MVREDPKAMDIYLIRHAVAFERDPVRWPEDSERPLMPKGIKRWHEGARRLGKAMKAPDKVLSSPFVRAWDTATILADEAGWPAPERCDALAAASYEGVIAALTANAEAGRIALVGHEPYLHELTSYLLTGDPAKMELAFKKGGVALVSFAEKLAAGAGVLRWLMTARALRELAA